MLKISTFAEKLNRFFSDRFEPNELHYTITIQLNFSIEVSLYMADTVSLDREILKLEYLEWFKTLPENSNKTQNDINEECKADFDVFFNNGDVRIYLKEFDDPGDPGDVRGPVKWGPRYRLSSLINRAHKESNLPLPPIVTFYSYKGGMGRTTTMMGFALWLAAKNKRVAIIDCDLEAPGYLNFFNLSNQIQFVEGYKNGFVEFMADYAFMRDSIEVNDYVVTPVPQENDNEAAIVYDNIFIVPAGNLNDGFIKEKAAHDSENEFEAKYRDLASLNRKDYIEGLSRLNLSNPTVLKRNFSALINKLKERYNIDIVLIDSRTGFNDVYGSTAFDLADKIVAFFGFSKQTMPGLKQLLENYVRKTVDISDERPLSLTLCNSILPSVESLNSDIGIRAKWSIFEKDFTVQVENMCSPQDVIVPTIFPIYRNTELEELGMDEHADLNFVNTMVNNVYDDYSNLFASLYNDIVEYFPQLETVNQISSADNFSGTNACQHIEHFDNTESLDYIRHMRPLQLTKVILRELKSKLETVANFAEQMDSQKKDMFLYRECMREIFNPNKFIVRGYKGAGKTCIYQALSQSNEVTDFIRARAGVESDCDFVNVIDFQGISNHPLKLLEDDGIFAGQRFFNINAFWQILMWKAIFTKKEYNHLLSQSEIQEQFLTLNLLKGHKLLIAIQDMIDGGASKVLASIEDDLDRLENYLEGKNRKLFIMYDGLDNVVKPKYWSRAISPLINKWGGNVNAYHNIHSKIFLRTDLFERIEGTNIERLKDNIVDIDWDIAEVFGYLFKLVLGSEDNPSREAMWSILRKLREESAEATIDNLTKAINNGLGQFPTFDRANLKNLVEIFFGRKVNPKGANLGDPWQYFEKQLSNAAGKISMRLFINTLTTDVIDKGLENSNPHVKEVISPDLYASREVRIKVAESYFNDMASEEDFTDDLQKLREYINSENGKEFRKKILSESEFNTLLNNIIITYKHDLRAVETPAEFAQLIYASGLMKEIYKRGRKIYRFSPMFEYPWGLVGKSYEEDDDNQEEKLIRVNDGNILEGILTINKFGKPAVNVGDRMYECESYTNFSVGTKVSFTVRMRPKVGKKGAFWLSSDLKKIK